MSFLIPFINVMGTYPTIPKDGLIQPKHILRA